MMKVQKHTGLVAVKLTKPVDNYRSGRTHGFQPKHAREIFRDGSGVPADVPAGIAFTEVWDGISDEPAATRTFGQRNQEPPNPGTFGSGGGGHDPSVIAIPDDWERRNAMANIATAKQILGDPSAKIKGAEAHDIIQNELDRRKAAE